MSRVQLALNVSDLEEAVSFYTKLFAVKPAKRKPGYANFEVTDPPLKLVLIEGPDGGSLNHLGVEVDHGSEVQAAEARLRSEGITTTGVDDTSCCYAFKTETWVNDPDGAPWEFYVKTGDAELMSPGGDPDSGSQCCSRADIGEAVSLGRSPAETCC